MRTELWRSAEDERPIVLVVDDEDTILETLSLQLRRDHRVITAANGDEALRLLAESGPVAAVISDMRMPGMNGIELLRRVQVDYPDTTRVLHTGYGDMSTAIAAINSGGVYRYLPKPAAGAELRSTVQEAVARHGQAAAERELLDKTLRTSVQALFGCLELASPVAFARAGRIRTLVAELCHELELDGLWEIEVAAMASQLGAVTVPPGVLAKLDRGLPLTGEEQAMVDAMPGVAVRLLGDIPMLHDVVDIVRGLSGSQGARTPLIEAAISVVRTAIEFEALDSRELSVESALALLECRRDAAPHVLGALRKLKGLTAAQEQLLPVRIADLQVGMRIAEDLTAINGLVLIGRGTVVTEVLLDRLTNFARTIELVEPVLAAVPEPSAG